MREGQTERERKEEREREKRATERRESERERDGCFSHCSVLMMMVEELGTCVYSGCQVIRCIRIRTGTLPSKRHRVCQNDEMNDTFLLHSASGTNKKLKPCPPSLPLERKQQRPQQHANTGANRPTTPLPNDRTSEYLTSRKEGPKSVK